MAFKGTHGRGCQQINLDAERLGAEVNAHTDKDHTAYHMRGLARDAASFVQCSATSCCNSSFPEAELERERQVMLQEFIEDEEDPLSTAVQALRPASLRHPPGRAAGDRPAAQHRRFTRDDLLGYVGAIHRRECRGRRRRPRSIPRGRRRGRGGLRRAARRREQPVERAAYVGGVAARRAAGCGQTHVVLGLPIPALARRRPRRRARGGAVRRGHELAADGRDPRAPRPRLLRRVLGRRDGAVRAVRGRGLDRARACSTSSSSRWAPARRAGGSDRRGGLERARNQIAVRRLRDAERPRAGSRTRRWTCSSLGRVRSRAELAARIDAVDGRRGARALSPACSPNAARGGDRRQAEEGRAGTGARAVRLRRALDLRAGLERNPNTLESVITRVVDSGQLEHAARDRIVAPLIRIFRAPGLGASRSKSMETRMNSTVAVPVVAQSDSNAYRWLKLFFGIVCMAMIANLQYGWTLFVDPMTTSTAGAGPRSRSRSRSSSSPRPGWSRSKAISSTGSDRGLVVLAGGVLCGWHGSSMPRPIPSRCCISRAAIGGIGAGAVYGTCVGNALKWFPGPPRPRRGADRRRLRRRLGADDHSDPAMIKSSGYEAAFLYFGIVQGVVVFAVVAADAAPPVRRSPAAASPKVVRHARDYTPSEMVSARRCSG